MSESGKTFYPKNKNKIFKSRMENDSSIIGMLYRDSINKIEQIKILSQLYLKSETEIAEFLFDNGYDDKYIRKYLK